MIIKVRATVEKYGMLRKGAKVVAAVSGGSDSMAMLYILNSLKEEFGFELCAAHVNHGLRGESADRDERLVAEKCALLVIVSGDVAGGGLDYAGDTPAYVYTLAKLNNAAAAMADCVYEAVGGLQIQHK